MTDEIRYLNINEDFEEDVAFTKKATTTSATTAATGLTILGRFAAARAEADGTPSASLGVTVTVAELSGEGGTYRCTADTAALVTNLTTYLHRDVYLILKEAGNMDCVFVKYRVTASREAAA